MRHDEYLDAIRRDSPALADAARVAGLGAPVPSCPGWNVRDLVWHEGGVLHFWGTVVAERLTGPEAYVEPDRPNDEGLLEWYADQQAFVLDTLASTDPAVEVWTWAGGQGTAGWVTRRMAQETAVHRSDAELAAGRPVDIDPALAADGIDEFFAYFAGPEEGKAPIGGLVHLHATDAEGEFVVDEPEVGGGLVARREHAKGDVAIRGRASDLLLLLWRRIPLDDRFEVFGDREMAERLVARTTLE